MKKFTRFMILLLIGGTTLFTSCVSEDVSPEVENLRQAQANLINSKAEFESARAENQKAEAEKARAEAALIQAEVEFQLAQNALLQLQIDLQEALQQAQTDAEIARLEAQVAEAQARVAAAQAAVAGSEADAEEARVRAAEAQLNLEEALADLAQFGTEVAQDLFREYEWTMRDARNVKDDIDNLNIKLARYEALRDSNGDPVAFLELIADAEEEIATKQAELATAQAEIARLEPLDGNADAARAELAEIKDELDVLQSELASAELELNRFLEESNYVAVVDALADVKLNLSQIAGFESDIAGKQGDIATQQGIIAGLQADIADVENGELARIQDLLAPYVAIIDDLDQRNPAATDQALALLESWREKFTVWEAEFIKGPGSADAQAAASFRVEARDEFLAYVWDDATTGNSPGQYLQNNYIFNPITEISGNSFAFDANSQYIVDLGADNSNLVTQNATYLDLKAQELVQLQLIAGYESDITTAEGVITTLEGDIATLEGDIADEEADNASIWASFGVADLTEHQAAVDALDEVRDPLVDAINAINVEISSLHGIHTVLTNYLSGNPETIALEIEGLESDITTLESDIEDAQQAIADGEFDQQEFEAMIVRVETELASLTEEYDALIALADTYLEQFYAALAD